MEVIGEAPPPLPPKSSKVRQTLKKAALESENASTLPSNVALKQKIIINQKPDYKEEKIIINNINNDNKNKNHKKNNSEKPVNGFRLINKSNHLIKSEVKKPQRRFETEDGFLQCSQSNRTVKINNNEKKNESPPPSKSLTVTSQSEDNNNNNAKSIAETYKTNFSNTRAKFVNGSECKTSGVISENRPKIITWAEKKKESKGLKINEWNKDNGTQEDEFLYQNVSNTGTNYIEYKLNGIISKKGVSNRKIQKSEQMIEAPRTSQIEVRQVKNKTVVKISINDNVQKETHFKPLKIEDDYTVNDYQYPDVLFAQSKPTATVNEYAEPFSNGGKAKETGDTGNYQKPGQVYANIDKSKKKNRRNKMEEENNLIYENSEVGKIQTEQFYANLDEKVVAEDEDNPELVYANLNEEPECDQVYENQEFEVLKNSKVTQSVIEKNPVPGDGDEKNAEQDVYENHDAYEEDANTYENTDLPRYVAKKNIILKNSPKPIARATQYHFNDPFFNKKDSTPHVEPEPESVPIPKNGKVIVTINNLPEDIIIKPIPKKSEEIAQTEEEEGNKRAESLTSSGVGVDSESENESNISCDSLNSNELNGLSTSEDHGYHTPENKTGSPVDVDYQNVNSSAFSPYEKKIDDDTYENTDIIQQVANVAQKIKNLRTESAGIYMAKRVESTDEETYENYRKPSPKTKKAPSPPKTALQQASVKTLPKGLLQDIRSRNVRLSSAYPKGEKPETVKETPVTKTIVNFNKQIIKGSTPRQVKKMKNLEKRPVNVEEKTYEERKTEPKIVEPQKIVVTTNKICAMEIDTDKFYKFHLFENREEANLDKNCNDDETFAGVKDYLNREKPAAITSAKGTIRGVKNRVKAGIATFLQMQENKNYKDKDAGKIVVYSTTMGIVRETYHKCLKVKQILKTLMVKFEERDVFMSTDAQDEIRERMKCDAILVPQVFVEGQHIGDAETIERLNESGELRKILKPYKSPDACSTCQVCGGYRLLPCRICKGSKKSIHRNSFTAEFVSLKCMACDQVGLTRCHAC